MAFKKIGLHVIEDRVDVDLLGTAPLVLLMDASVGYAQRARAAMRSDAWLVIRWFQEDQNLDNPEARAVDWFMRHREQIGALKGPRTVFQGYNEIGSAQAGAYALFEHRRAELLWNVGAGLGLGAWSVGEPHESLWHLFADTLREMDPQRDAVLLHEYWPEPFDIHNPWYCGRWRVPEVGAALAGQTVLITETGRDVLWENNSKRGWAGWRRVPGLSEAGFLIEIDTYDQMITPFADVKGAALFSGGKTDYGWQNYDVNELWAKITEQQTAASPPSAPSAPEPVPVCDALPIIERVRMPMANLNKAWYETTRSPYFGEYDGHPQRAEDMNLETGGNSDLGEPLVAPFDGLVIHAADYGGAYGGVVSILARQHDGRLVTWQGRHMQNVQAAVGQMVAMGQAIGEIGNCQGRYSAHLHHQVALGAVPGPLQDWRDPRFGFVQPSRWFREQGLAEREIDRLRAMDGQ